MTPANLPQVTRRSSKPKKKWLLNHKALEKDTVQSPGNGSKCTCTHSCSAQRVHGCGNDCGNWHASPLHFIEKDPAVLGAHKTQGSKTGQLLNNSTQQIPERVHCGVESSTLQVHSHCKDTHNLKLMQCE